MTTNTERQPASQPRREPRHRAREAAIQMLYQWEVGRTSIDEVVRTFWTHGLGREPLSEPHRQLAADLASGVVASVESLDSLIANAAEHWRIERMAVIDRLILRLAVYEFLHRQDTPARVVINEALELARTFSTDDAVRFINGILDGIRRSPERE